MYDDPVLLLLLGSSETYPNSEERRLFYVALTRAKINL
ncbi:3'-5' exonuclease [Chryseobacterium sp. ERMR1:04]